MAARVSSAPIFPKGQLVLVWHLEQHLERDPLKSLMFLVNKNRREGWTENIFWYNLQRLHWQNPAALQASLHSVSSSSVLYSTGSINQDHEVRIGKGVKVQHWNWAVFGRHTIGSSQGENLFKSLLQTLGATTFHKWLHLLRRLLPFLANQDANWGFSCPPRSPYLQWIGARRGDYLYPIIEALSSLFL